MSADTEAGCGKSESWRYGDAGFAIDAGFPGGNIVVERVDGDEVFVRQDLRDTGRFWFYWCFRVRGARGRRLKFNFTGGRVIGVRGPAVSLDGGDTWAWLGSDGEDFESFEYDFAEDEVTFSFGMPYLESHWARFREEVAGHPLFSSRRLCTTREGREAEYALVGRPGFEPRHRIALGCRHHCCEMMASYALEGLLRWVLLDPGGEAAWLREHAGFFALPFADKDGVERGDQGKGRMPRDHGRDYQGESIYPAPAAVRELLPEWGGGRLRVVLDLHCPGMYGDYNEVIYLVGSSSEDIAREQRRFSDALVAVRTGPLPFDADDYLPFGTAWNKGANYSDGRGFSRWAGDEIPGVRLASALEIPYANAGGAEVNQESAGLFGRDLGAALAGYLKSLAG